MNKIMKRLLTGVLTLATVFIALPVTQVHAADSVYTTTDGKAGTIVKVDNGGSEVSSFEESIMTADGQTAYCVDINTDFQSGYKNRIDAKDRMSSDQISDVALNLEYVKQYAEKHSLSSKQVYLLKQCVVWRRLSVHLGWGYNNVRAAYDEVSEKIQSEVYENAKAFAKENKDRYDCGGYIYTGDGQDLGQFWAKLAVGNGKVQKSSSNTAITESNNCYSIAGAVYGVYSDKGCTKSVATLTTNATGNTDTVELRAATYYVKETKAPKGFRLDKNVHTLTVKAGETATLKVSDIPNGNMVITQNPTISSIPTKSTYEPKARESDGTVDAATTEEVTEFLETFFKLYPTATEKELAYYVSGDVLEPVNCDYVFSELVNPIFTQDGEQVKVSVSVKYLDQRTKATQISQFGLLLEKTGGNWKIVG